MKLRLIKELLGEVMRGHADPKSSDWNECAETPCLWCFNAKDVIEEIDVALAFLEEHGCLTIFPNGKKNYFR